MYINMTLKKIESKFFCDIDKMAVMDFHGTIITGRQFKEKVDYACNPFYFNIFCYKFKLFKKACHLLALINILVQMNIIKFSQSCLSSIENNF